MKYIENHFIATKLRLLIPTVYNITPIKGKCEYKSF